MYTPDSVRRQAPVRHLSQPRVAPWAGAAWPAGCCPTHLLRCGEIQLRCSRTHSPCSQLHARLAGHIAVAAGRHLPYPFTPGQLALVGLLSVAVVVTLPLPARALTYGFVRQPCPPGCPGRLGVGKFLCRSTSTATAPSPHAFSC